MKKNYLKPTMSVVLLQHQTTLLSGSDKGWDAIGQGEDNLPPGARQRGGWDDWDE